MSLESMARALRETQPCLPTWTCKPARTPGCSCKGLREAVAERDRYRSKALDAACRARIAGGATCKRDGCPDRHGYCPDVLREVDGA